MKRLLLVFALVLLPVSVFAQAAGADRDVLLTSDGTLLTIESEYTDTHPELNIKASQFLLLTMQSGDKVTQSIVPDSTSEGLHRRPALAYDAESHTVFVFWLRSPNAMSSELLVASYQDGKWRQATSIDDKPLSYRFNLRIAVTHRVAQLQRDGSTKDVPMVVVHAVWWESTGAGETARYAMLPVDHGRLLLTEPEYQIHDLNEFVPAQLTTYDVPENFNREILRHPAILDSTSNNSVDVLFADAKTNSFNRTTLRPIMSDGRLRIPVGIGRGNRPNRFPAPQSFSGDWTGRIDTVASSHEGTDRVVIYNVGDKAVSYVVFEDGKWSNANAVALSEKLSADAAVTALSRMANATE